MALEEACGSRLYWIDRSERHASCNCDAGVKYVFEYSNKQVKYEALYAYAYAYTVFVYIRVHIADLYSYYASMTVAHVTTTW